MMICCGMTLKRMGMLGVGVRNITALTVKMETVMLIAYVPLGEKSPHYLLNGRLVGPKASAYILLKEKDIVLARLTHMYNNDTNDIIILHGFPVLVPIVITDFFLVVLISFTSHWARVISFHTLSKLFFSHDSAIQHFTFIDEKLSLNK